MNETKSSLEIEEKEEDYEDWEKSTYGFVSSVRDLPWTLVYSKADEKHHNRDLMKRLTDEAKNGNEFIPRLVSRALKRAEEFYQERGWGDSSSRGPAEDVSLQDGEKISSGPEAKYRIDISGYKSGTSKLEEKFEEALQRDAEFLKNATPYLAKLRGMKNDEEKIEEYKREIDEALEEIDFVVPMTDFA